MSTGGAGRHFPGYANQPSVTGGFVCYMCIHWSHNHFHILTSHGLCSKYMRGATGDLDQVTRFQQDLELIS